MKKTIIATCLIAGFSSLAAAVNPMWVREPKISPDGKQIAFGYKGDIYIVSADGGEARRLTTGPSYENAPVWSPDGTMIAYASDRNGGKDVYIIPSKGGTPVRLTSHSANETPEAFTPDGKEVLFSAIIQDPVSSAQFQHRSQSELYAVSVDGGKVRQVLGVPALNVAMRPDGSFLYEEVKGGEDKWRKHHTSSTTRDIWLRDPKTDRYVNLTNHAGEDRSPAISADGKTYYFLSERNGSSANVYAADIQPGASVRKLTDFTDHPVRYLSTGAGDRMAFVYNGELYTMTPGQQPSKLDISLIDDNIDDIQTIPFSRVREAVVSPDGKQMAYTERGEVFVSSTEYPSIKQVSHTPAIETGLSWGADGRSLYYGSLRSGRSNIYKATIKRKEDPNFSNATLIEEKAMFPDDGIERGYPSISPDGKKMAYVEDRRILKVMDLASGKITTYEDKITNRQSGGFDVEWSPDSKWLALEIMNPMHDPYDDIAIVNVETGEFISLTNTGYFDQNPHFTPDGNAVVFASERFGMRNHASWGSEFDVMMVFLNQEAYDKYRLSEEDYALLKDVEAQQKKASAKKEDAKKDDKKGKNAGKDAEAKKEDAPKNATRVEPEGIMERVVRLTPNSSNLGDYAISKEGDVLYYLASFEGGSDLWKKDLRKRDVSLVKKGAGNGAIQTDKDGNMWIVGSTVKKFNPKSKDLKTVSVSGNVKIDPAKEREAMLDYVANEARERFYLPEMPIDWDMYVENYRRFLPHINNGYDFGELLSELLGELNVSHSGGRYYPESAEDPTASLGLLYDMSGKKDGVIVGEVVKGGPFDRATSKVRPGDEITAINGVSTDSEGNWETLLNNTARKKTLVSFRRPSSGETWDEVVLPISSGAMNSLMYKRWVAGREAAVDSLSGGRLGYVHIKSMDDDSFRDIYSKLLGKYYSKEGVVIDTRWNGGGRLHEDIEVLFSGDKYLTQEIHGRPSGEMPSRRWNKPSVMIIGEANYSNAHGTPWVYKHKNLGKLVGMPVPGTMSSVNWITLQDPSLVFGVPVVAFRTADGYVLENTQLEPDIKVKNEPGDIVRGRDAQLEAAVKSLLGDIDAAKKK